MKPWINLTTAALAIIALAACEKIFLPEPENHPLAIFDDLWANFDELYAPFEERGVDWDAQYEAYRPQVQANTSDAELFDILAAMLATLDDGHVSLTAPGREVFFSNHIRREKPDDDLFSLNAITANYLEASFQADRERSYVYGKIRGENIGYIYFDYIGANSAQLREFLSAYAAADGYIIDLRHNRSGDFTHFFAAMQPLVDQRRLVFRSKTKNGSRRGDFTPWHEWHIEPSGRHNDKPIVVLTDRYTISAGERVVMAFKALPQAILLGDTTNGAQGTMIARELPNGWSYSLVPQKTQMFDGISYEGIGIAPDICIKNSREAIQAGRDQVLERAIGELK